MAENAFVDVVCPPQKTGVTLRSRAAIDVWNAVKSPILPTDSDYLAPVVRKRVRPLSRNCHRCGASPVRVKFCSDACRQAAYREREAQYRATSAAYANLQQEKESAIIIASDKKFASKNRYRAIEFDGRYAGVDYEFAPNHREVKIPAEAYLTNAVAAVLEKTQE